MTLSKTIATILATAVIGTFTFLFVQPSKGLKNSAKVFKTSKSNKREKENLFI